MNSVDTIPEGLHAVQYAHGICEDSLGMPAVESNLKLIADCITAISKKLFRGRTDGLRLATFWLQRRIQAASEQGQKITTHWLRNGEYWDVEKPQAWPKPAKYEHYGEGYGTGDMLWLFDRYQAKCKSIPHWALTEAEVEGLLRELDQKRGGAPEWRR